MYSYVQKMYCCHLSLLPQTIRLCLTLYIIWFSCQCVSVYVQNNDRFVIQLLNGIGDYIDLRHAISPHLRPNFHRMSLEQIKEYIAVNGHCSALVKVLLCIIIMSYSRSLHYALQFVHFSVCPKCHVKLYYYLLSVPKSELVKMFLVAHENNSAVFMTDDHSLMSTGHTKLWHKLACYWEVVDSSSLVLRSTVQAVVHF